MVHTSKNVVSPEQAALRNDFWAALPDALFCRKTVAAALCMSVSWLEKLATSGGGPGYSALGKRKVLYRKSDVVEWFSKFARHSTSDSGLQLA